MHSDGVYFGLSLWDRKEQNFASTLVMENLASTLVMKVKFGGLVHELCRPYQIRVQCC